MTRSAIVTPPPFLAPRVLVVLPAQWQRALMRAALREVGYDAVGTSSLETALRLPAVDPERGAVGLVIMDQSALSGAGGAQLDRFISQHGAPALLLLASATLRAPAGPWHRVLQRPVSVADVVTAVQDLLPLPATSRHRLD